MKSLGVKYLSLSDTWIFSGSMPMHEDVEVFMCTNCRRLEFYLVSPPIVNGSFSDQMLYDAYKDYSTEKLEKMLSSSKYTDDCKEVIKSILPRENNGKNKKCTAFKQCIFYRSNQNMILSRSQRAASLPTVANCSL